ncbi:MAG: glutamate-5-semialdehyde dehydrogenase [Firmicutes bacterium]|nr:glutamate-5-semialdehyde dehydrogenase [Bacillota bacterium]
MTALEMQGAAAKKAAAAMALADTETKNKALLAIADALIARQDEWLAANAEDYAAAKENGMSSSMLDRLQLTASRIEGVAEGVRQAAALPDPIGTVTKDFTRPNGMHIRQKRVPLGVIGMIFESRPNVAVDAAVLCLKAGNACILRGGKESFRSNLCAESIMRDALESAGLPADAVSLVHDTSRETAKELMHLEKYIDILIPRGGAGLIRSVTEEASVPVIRTGDGICHVYVDSEADIPMAANIVCNARCSRPSVCNSVECVVVHKAVAEAFFNEVLPLLDKYNVEIRGDFKICNILGTRAKEASDADWDTEYNDYILAAKTVSSVEEAVDFINAHGTQHSECIVTKNEKTAEFFLNGVDAAAVYWNVSTRFTDGFEFGLGAEIGISTQKLHARGPMGLEELTSWKYYVSGDGQIR